MPQSLKITFGCVYAISEIPYTGTVGSFPTLTRAFPGKPDKRHCWQLHSGGNRQASASDAGTRKYSSIFSTWDSCLVNIPTPAVAWKNCHLCTYFTKYKRWTNKRKLGLKKRSKEKRILSKCDPIWSLSSITAAFRGVMWLRDYVGPLHWVKKYNCASNFVRSS